MTDRAPTRYRGKRLSRPSGLQTTPDIEFEVIERDVLRVVDRGIRVRIPRWRARQYEKAGR